MKVIVPAKSYSERCINKNFRPFYKGKNLLDIKLEQLLTAFDKKDIVVSSDCAEGKISADKYSVGFVEREEIHTRSDTPWSDTLVSLFNSLGKEQEVMALAHTTTPLFYDFENALKAWNSKALPANHDSLLVVNDFKHFVLNENGMPVNFNFGRWHIWSQNLPQWYTMACAFYIITREALDRCAYYIGERPFLFPAKNFAIDIDTEEEFRIAQLIYTDKIKIHK